MLSLWFLLFLLRGSAIGPDTKPVPGASPNAHEPVIIIVK
jgi:hypothetical protein